MKKFIYLIFFMFLMKMPVNAQDIKDSTENKKDEIENHFSNSYIFFPAAIPLKKNNFYLQNANVLFLSCSYSVTDIISVGGGLEYISLFDNNSPGYWLNIKASKKIAKNLYFGGGMFTYIQKQYGYYPLRSYNYDVEFAPYILLTYGNSNKNISCGITKIILYDNTINKYTFDEIPVSIILSGIYRISKHFALVTENWILFTEGETGVFHSIDIRIFNKKILFETGLVAPVGYFKSDGNQQSDFNLIPVFKFTYKFSKK